MQKAHNRVTLISQKPAEDENAYADRIISASQDCSNVFEDHTLVHSYARGLLETSIDKVIEDMRRLPEHEQRDLTSIRRLAFAQGNTVRAQSQATSKARTPSQRRTPTMYVSEDPQPEPYFRNPDLPNLLNHRAGMLSDFRVRDPETARNIAIGLEIILFTGATSGSSTPTSMNSDAIAASVGVDLVRTPVHRETVPIPTLTEKQTRQAFSVIPSNYWQLNSWTCRDCGHSTFTCPTLTLNQRMYFAYRYYLDQIKGNPTMAQFLEQKKERRVQLTKERAEYDGKRPGDKQRPQLTPEYPGRHDNRPRTMVHRSDERYSRPYDNSRRGSYGSRGRFRGGRGRGRSVHFGDRRGVYVQERWKTKERTK